MSAVFKREQPSLWTKVQPQRWRRVHISTLAVSSARPGFDPRRYSCRKHLKMRCCCRVGVMRCRWWVFYRSSCPIFNVGHQNHALEEGLVLQTCANFAGAEDQTAYLSRFLLISDSQKIHQPVDPHCRTRHKRRRCKAIASTPRWRWHRSGNGPEPFCRCCCWCKFDVSLGSRMTGRTHHDALLRSSKSKVLGRAR